MEAIAEVGILAVATVLAAGAAWGLAWAFLRGAFRLIDPAGASDTGVRTTKPGQAPMRPRLELVGGTRAAVRAFGRS